MDAALVAELDVHATSSVSRTARGNRDLFAGYMQAQSPTFAVLTGNGPMFHHAMTTGARGGILAVSLFAPAPVARCVRLECEAVMSPRHVLPNRLTPIGEDRW